MILMVIITEGMDGSADGGVNDDLEEGEGGADGVGVEGEGGGGSEEAVHDVVGVWGEANEKEQFRALFDGADDTLDVWVVIEPQDDGIAKKHARKNEDQKGAGQGSEIGDEGANPGPVGVA